MKQSVYEQKEVKELIDPNANHGFWARQKRHSMIHLKWGLLGLLLIAVIMPSLGIKSSDIKEVDNLMTMEELGYNQTETLSTAIVTPLKDITNEIGIIYQMNINDPTIRPGEYFSVTLNISKLDVIENVDIVLKKDLVHKINHMEKQFPDAGLEVFTEDTFEEMIKCFTEMDTVAWNADKVYSLHDYHSLSQFPCNHLIYLIKDNVLIELEFAYDMEITEERIEVFSQLFARFNELISGLNNE